MERLTKSKDGKFIGFIESNGREMNYLPPDKIGVLLDHLTELEDKLESGLLLELPCKVGNTVWYLNTRPSISLKTNTIYEGQIVRFQIKNYEQSLGTVESATIQIHNEYGTTEFPKDIKDLGMSWFLTKSQAEARLKELKEKS